MNSQGTAGRFNPAFCGRVVRIAAAVCVGEFLLTMALLMTWVPADSACRAWTAPREAPEPIYAAIFPAGFAALWMCIIAIFWKHFANLVFTQLGWEERQRASIGWFAALYRWLQPVQLNFAALLTVIFFGFAALVAIPLVIILRKCGP